MYGVVVCPRCKRAKGVDLKQKTTSCSCGFEIRVLPVRVKARAETARELAPLVARVNAELVARIHAAGGAVEAVLCCPHAPEERCGCRKPEPGLVTRALLEHKVAAEHAVLVGDSAADVDAAHRAGVRAIRVLTGSDVDDAGATAPDAVARDLSAAVDVILDGLPASPTAAAHAGEAR